MTEDIAGDRNTSRGEQGTWPEWRVWAIRAWYGLLFAWALSASRGVLLLALGEAGDGERFAYATVTAWKLLATGAVFWISWTGGRSVVAFHTLIVGMLGWLLSDRLWAVRPPDDSPVISTVATIALWIIPLVALRPDRKQLLRVRAQPSAILLPLALVASALLVTYAAHQGSLATDPVGQPIPYDMTGLGAVLAVQALFAALRPAGSMWLPRLVAFAAGWAGLAGFGWPDDSGSFGRGWGSALIGWACVFVVAAEFEDGEPAAGVRRLRTTI